MTRDRLRAILVEHFAKHADELPAGSDVHVAALRRGEHHAGAALRATLDAMEFAINESWSKP
jgi:hypothetical protein